MALAWPLLWRARRVGAAAAVCVAAVGFAQVAAAVHYPSDLLGSAAIALLPSVAALAWCRRSRRGSRSWAGSSKRRRSRTEPSLFLPLVEAGFCRRPAAGGLGAPEAGQGDVHEPVEGLTVR
jgi:hypothetical protein